REARIDLVEQRLTPRSLDVGAIETRPQILEHRQQTKDPSVLGDIADPQAREAIRRQAGDVTALENDPPTGGPDEPHDRLWRPGFADAVAAAEADDFPAAYLERHAVQDVRFRVQRVDGGEGPHQGFSATPWA